MKSTEPTPSRLRTGDLVEVISGRDRGKRGRILRMLRREGRAIVEGVQMIKKGQKATDRGTPSGFVHREAPVHVSNLMIVDPVESRPSRIGMRVVTAPDGSVSRVRYAKLSGALLDPQ